MARTKAGEGPSKMSLVREALGELGHEAKPRVIHDHILTKHQVDIPTQMISSYKSMLSKGPKTTGKKRGRKSNAEKAAMLAMEGKALPGRSGGEVSINDIADVKALINRHGARKLSDLINALV